MVDHGRINPELGGDAGLEVFATALKAAGLGLILDTVPNHMGVFDPANGWWMDVLENGPSSTVAGHFDIDWQPVKRELAGRVLLPILEDQYGSVLERGKFRLVHDEGSFFVYAGAVKLPVAPGTYNLILDRRREELVTRLGATNEHVLELLSILTQIHNLPSRNETDPEKLTEQIGKRRSSSGASRRCTTRAPSSGPPSTPRSPSTTALPENRPALTRWTS